MTTKPKRLYVVSSLHGTDTLENQVIRGLGIEDVLKTRLAVIEALARTCGNGNYFSDGLSQNSANRITECIRDLPLDEIKARNIAVLSSNLFGLYEVGRLVELFKVLTAEGIDFRLKETERDYSSSLLTRQELSTPNAMRLRDLDMVENALKSDREENILFVGSEHKLETLSESGLEVYRLDVLSDNIFYHEVKVRGTLPVRFQTNMQNVQKFIGEKPCVICEIDYVGATIE